MSIQETVVSKAMFSLLDVVKLEVDLPEEGLGKGAQGAIVYEFYVPNVAYEVEFTSAEPGELLTVTLLPVQISLIWAAPEME